MNKLYIAVFATTIGAASLLSGCQFLTGYQQLETAESAEEWAGKINAVAGETNIACFGTYHCEITRIDNTMIVSPDTHLPVNNSMLVEAPKSGDVTPLSDSRSVKIVPLAKSGTDGLINYYARVKPVKREVLVNFYPQDNLDYVERFAIIHEFVEGSYQLRAYQKKPKQDSGSLLENASPNPLCIELVQDGKTVRRFCKQDDAEHQGEFVETRSVN